MEPLDHGLPVTGVDSRTYIDWCHQLWDSLNDGGTWAVPRSGLVFQKDTANMQLKLIFTPPWDETCPVGPDELEATVDADIENIGRYFAAFGVELTRA